MTMCAGGAHRGTVRTQRKDGAFLNLAFCDVFEMHGGKIRRLISYLMEAK